MDVRSEAQRLQNGIAELRRGALGKGAAVPPVQLPPSLSRRQVLLILLFFASCDPWRQGQEPGGRMSAAQQLPDLYAFAQRARELLLGLCVAKGVRDKLRFVGLLNGGLAELLLICKNLLLPASAWACC